MKTMKAIFPMLIIAAALFAGGAGAMTPEESALLDAWCAAQTRIHTWTADAVQTRELATINQPLVSTGRVWVAAPDRFRWELGQPAQTVAVRRGGELVLAYPRLKRAEKYSLDGGQSGPMRDALSLIEAAFPRSRAELESHFKVLSLVQTNGAARLSLEPKSGFAKQFMAEVQISFSAADFTPLSTELKFSDGSRMRNEFSRGVVNPPIDERVFDVEIGPDYKVTEPLKR